MALLSLFHGKLLTIRKDMMFIADKVREHRYRHDLLPPVPVL
jgi:hypothetical protein